VGAGNATTHIKDGQIVEVDGGTGTIRIISPT
jgi:phosphohistidine swiveling domain-containing protein